MLPFAHPWEPRDRTNNDAGTVNNMGNATVARRGKCDLLDRRRNCVLLPAVVRSEAASAARTVPSPALNARMDVDRMHDTAGTCHHNTQQTISVTKNSTAPSKRRDPSPPTTAKKLHGAGGRRPAPPVDLRRRLAQPSTCQSRKLRRVRDLQGLVFTYSAGTRNTGEGSERHGGGLTTSSAGRRPPAARRFPTSPRTAVRGWPHQIQNIWPLADYK